MKKRLVSIILTVFLVLSMMPFAAFADNAIVCPACGGEVTKKTYHLVGNYWDFYKCNTCGKWAYLSAVVGLKLLSAGDQAIINAADANAILNFAFNNGHLIPAEKVPSGIGRKDLPGYASDNGIPNYDSNGELQIVVYPRLGSSSSELHDYPAEFYITSDNYSVFISGLKVSCKSVTSKYNSDFYIYSSYDFIAPVSGTYYVASRQCYLTNRFNFDIYNDDYISAGRYSKKLVAGSSGVIWDSYITSRFYVYGIGYGISSYTSFYHPIILNVIPDTPTVKQQTNITINNNTWNGNIYTDNSTNLTYIYPQYTTINEHNETVTNISNNPIIYNNETKQYYTYDTVTNNYYYITYEQPATPTPTPTPGGGTTVTPGGDNPGSTSTPESGNKGDSGSSGWNPFKWLTDLLKDIVETILKGLWKLLTSIFGFILWLLSLLFKLFPWIPNSGILALCAGVVVVTVIRIIKFITGR